LIIVSIAAVIVTELFICTSCYFVAAKYARAGNRGWQHEKYFLQCNQLFIRVQTTANGYFRKQMFKNRLWFFSRYIFVLSIAKTTVD